MNTNVYISILNWNSWQDCVTCVRSLEQMIVHGVKLTIGIVDNASPNNSVEELKKALPEYEIVALKTNRGYAAGHLENVQRAKALRADLFWILNTDVVVTPNALSALITAYREQGNCIFGSVTLNNDETVDFGGSDLEEINDRLLYNDWQGKPYDALVQQYPKGREVQSIEGSSFMIPMPIIEEHGFMKTDFFMYGEEIDYCLRLKEQGVRSYIVTKSTVFHSNEGSFKDIKTLRFIPIYYRRRNSLRLNLEYFQMSKSTALGFKDGIFNNLKSIVKGLTGKKDESYYYALGALHAYLGIKGKIIVPESLYNR